MMFDIAAYLPWLAAFSILSWATAAAGWVSLIFWSWSRELLVWIVAIPPILIVTADATAETRDITLVLLGLMAAVYATVAAAMANGFEKQLEELPLLVNRPNARSFARFLIATFVAVAVTGAASNVRSAAFHANLAEYELGLDLEALLDHDGAKEATSSQTQSAGCKLAARYVDSLDEMWMTIEVPWYSYLRRNFVVLNGGAGVITYHRIPGSREAPPYHQLIVELDKAVCEVDVPSEHWDSFDEERLSTKLLAELLQRKVDERDRYTVKATRKPASLRVFAFASVFRAIGGNGLEIKPANTFASGLDLALLWGSYLLTGFLFYRIGLQRDRVSE